MFKINLLDTKFRCLIIMLLGALSLQAELTLINKTFFLGIIFICFYLNKIEFRFKVILISIFSLIVLYVQLIIENHVFSKDYFINILGLLLILRFSDLNQKKKLFSFSLIALVISVVSLINSQDIISSILSLIILTLTIINFYLINQNKVIDLNFKNLIKVLSVSFLIFPIIIVIYLIFPRTEINIKILESSNTNLGIPDEIGLGSFQSFADSTKKVFTLNTKKFEQKDLYFRVKTFDYLTPDKTWISSKEDFLLKNFKQQLKLSKPKLLDDSYDIILENHNKKWVPSLRNYTVTNGLNNHYYSFFNQTHQNYIEIEKKKIIQFTKFEQKNYIGDDLKKFYTQLPNSISNDLVNWVKVNKQNRSDKEYLTFLMNYFNQNDFYYNLSPKVTSKNDYADFFFNSKEGYCEYYAGMFVILTRLANIPSRIVSGYFGGTENEFGDFYEFTQSDSHAWTEVWLDDLGWVRFDPTTAIPPSRVKNSINQFLDQNNENLDKQFSFKIYDYARNYFTYLDYKWTTSFIEYDKKTRDEFINKINYKYLLVIFAPFIIFQIFKLILLINKRNLVRLLFNLIIILSSKKQKILKSDTPHQAFDKLNLTSKKRYSNFFKIYIRSIYS